MSENLIITGEEVSRLLAARDARAALLFLRLKTAPVADPAASTDLASELGWSMAELRAAAALLESLELLPKKPPEPAEELPRYETGDLTRALNGDPIFAEIWRYTQNRLGRTLTTEDINRLLGIYQYLGFPAGAIFLLVSYCDDRAKRRGGETARVTLLQIEREAWKWVREGVSTERDAEQLVRRLEETDQRVNRLRRMLQIGDRAPTATERNYLEKWSALPLADDVIYAAYDRTVVNTGALKWSYMNRILEDWNANGLPEELGGAAKAAPAVPQKPAGPTAPERRPKSDGAGRVHFSDPDRARRLREKEERKKQGN